jgi:hypothetical protein
MITIHNLQSAYFFLLLFYEKYYIYIYIYIFHTISHTDKILKTFEESSLYFRPDPKHTNALNDGSHGGTPTRTAGRAHSKSTEGLKEVAIKSTNPWSSMILTIPALPLWKPVFPGCFFEGHRLSFKVLLPKLFRNFGENLKNTFFQFHLVLTTF